MRNCACVSRCSLALCRSSFSRVGSSLLYTACNLLKHNDDRDLVTNVSWWARRNALSRNHEHDREWHTRKRPLTRHICTPARMITHGATDGRSCSSQVSATDTMIFQLQQSFVPKTGICSKGMNLCVECRDENWCRDTAPC